MIGLPQKRGFLSSHWQILLTNNTLNLAILVGVTYVALMVFAAANTAGAYIVLTVMYVSGASTFFLPLTLILLLIRKTRQVGGGMLYLTASVWLIWLWLFSFTVLYQASGKWTALLGFAVSLVSSGLGLFAIFGIFALMNGQWFAFLTTVGGVVLCRVASNAGKSFMGMRPSQTLRRWVMADDPILIGENIETLPDDILTSELSNDLTEALERWRNLATRQIEETHSAARKARDIFTDDYDISAGKVRDFCEVLLTSNLENFEARSESELPSTPNDVLVVLRDCAEQALERGEDEATIELLRTLYVSVGKFIPEADAKVVNERSLWHLAPDLNEESPSSEEEANRLREEILNEENRLDDEFDQVLTEIEQEQDNAEVVRLQKKVDRVKAEFEAELALASWRNDDRESALRSYTTALMLGSEHAVVLLNRGNLQLEMGLFEDGIADLEKARTLDPSLPCGNADIFKHLSPDLREAVRQSMLKGGSLKPPNDE